MLEFFGFKSGDLLFICVMNMKSYMMLSTSLHWYNLFPFPVRKPRSNNAIAPFNNNSLNPRKSLRIYKSQLLHRPSPPMIWYPAGCPSTYSVRALKPSLGEKCTWPDWTVTQLSMLSGFCIAGSGCSGNSRERIVREMDWWGRFTRMFVIVNKGGSIGRGAWGIFMRMERERSMERWGS